MPSKIRILDELTINKIAAGEVIETSASVVKELVENALDAGSTQITVEILSGGRQLIRVADNGCGMGRDDALLCLERYATSKIRDVDDLFALTTMGFRGEALPSIASISKLTLHTATAEESTLIQVEGGVLLKCESAVRRPGTTLEVRDLFFNIPVRKKFQRSPAYDTAAIQKCVALAALSHPHIQFTLISDQKTLLVAPAEHGTEPLQQLHARTCTVLGDLFANSLVPLEALVGPIAMHGWIGSPEHHRPNRSGQYLFINRRAVLSPLLSAALRDGYGPALPNQRYPICIFHLQLPGEEIDVNVHPQKREVRHRQERELREIICQAVQQSIHGPLEIHQAVLTGPIFPPFTKTEFPSPSFLPWDPPISQKGTGQLAREVPVLFSTPKAIPTLLTCLPGYLLLDPHQCTSLGGEQGSIWIVDQRAAHCRILFDRLTVVEVPMSIERQQLLFPLVLHLSSVEQVTLTECLPELERLGFEIKPLGPSSLCVSAFPTDYLTADLQQLIPELVEELTSLSSQEQLAQERAKRLARRCSSAAYAKGTQLHVQLAETLLKELFSCSEFRTCPFGTPILACISPKEITKLFR